MGQAAGVSVGRQIFRPPFQYSLLVTATLLAKLVHLYSHRTSLPILLSALYLPTFLALDFVNAALFWGLAHVTVSGRGSILVAVIRGFICLGLLSASSSQIAFYFETGGELKWGQAGNFAGDLAGIKLLLSGSGTICLVAAFTTVVAAVISSPLYNGTWSFICSLSVAFLGRTPGASKFCKNTPNTPRVGSAAEYEPILAEEEGLDDISLPGFEPEPKVRRVSRLARWLGTFKFIVPAVVVTVLLVVRPRHFPFAHMSASIPWTLSEIWTGNADSMCMGGHFDALNSFPLPGKIATQYWEKPDGKFPGWRPTVNATSMSNGTIPLPSWLPKESMPGFDRWYGEVEEDHHHHHQKRHGHGRGHKKQHKTHKEQYSNPNYDPAGDPLRISNMDQDVFKEIKEALKNSKINIKHVVILSLESTRKDVFPFKKDSQLHKVIKETHRSEDSLAKSEEALAELTLNAELLTGETSGFSTGHYTNASKTLQKLPKDKGGLNIQGALTGSTSTFKSMLGSHCGVQPLPVDFTVEAHGHIYQPCIPTILNLLNHNKNETTEKDEKDMRTRPWKSVFVQSITDRFDHQDDLNVHMGFGEVVVSSTLQEPGAKHPPTEPESNYFGFPETQIKPYLRDLFTTAKEKNERLFLSHFTSSTHHPWNLPPAFGESVDYLDRGKVGAGQTHLNRYLNTIKYGDWWIGEVMDMLSEFGMAEETLVVMVGDHGFAFSEDSTLPSTFENGHISILRVPLLFHHPLLPRIQLSLNTTSLSILPTILDLLTTTNSLSEEDTEVTSNLIHQYEGQSLLRPFLPQKSTRENYILTVLNAGGSALSISSSLHPYRLVLPICKNGKYRYTNTDLDPHELKPMEKNGLKGIIGGLKKAGRIEEGGWVLEAEEVAMWWVREQRRRWRFGGKSLQSDRTAEEMKGVGTTRGKKWWET